jgi:hypothetical protein
MSNFIINIFSIITIHNCIILALLVLDNLVTNYLILLDILVKKILTYPMIYYINIALGMALIFTYFIVKLILNSGSRITITNFIIPGRALRIR